MEIQESMEYREGFVDFNDEESKGQDEIPVVMETQNSMVAFDDDATPTHDMHLSQLSPTGDEKEEDETVKLSAEKSKKVMNKKFKSYLEGEQILATYTASLK
jgi:hypothetical protein